MGAQQALADLGLEKNAFFLGAAAKGLWGLASKPLLGVANRIGGWALGGAKAMGASPKTMGFLSNLGRGAARDAASFGLFGGGLNAALADPGQRGEAFLRGAAGGMLGGAAWRMGGNAARMGLQRGLGQKAWQGLEAAGKPGWFSSPKAFGSKMVTSGLPFAGAMGASSFMPTFDKEPDAPQTWGGSAQQQVANYGQPQYAGYMPPGYGS